jgi:D-threonate/D-erythronate kinase
MAPVKRLLIVADDFAGAADCGAAFAQRGLPTRAVLEARAIVPGWTVVALDTDTRDTSSWVAEERVGAAIAATAPEDVIFKKVDSTLRGNLTAELRAVLRHRPRELVIAAPAFPATGRTTRGGRQLLNGRPLEESEFGAQVSSSSLRNLLGDAGLAVRTASLEEVRSGRLDDLVRRTGAGTVLICDAETDDDLEAVALGGINSGSEIVWLGSAGLARGLADVLELPRDRAGASRPVADRPLLLVLGSPATATRAQLRRLCETPAVAHVAITGARGGGASSAELTESVLGALRSGRDCALSLAPETDQRERERGRARTRQLAAVAAAAIELAGGLVLTGGETARAVLEAIPGSGVSLQREIAPGIAFGWTDPPISLPVALKAGGFGDEDALLTCRRVMRDNRQEDGK